MPVVFPQQGGEAGIRDTLSHMERLTNNAFLSPVIRRQAAKASAHCHPSDSRCIAASLMVWVQRTMRFMKDPLGVEALHDPVMIAKEIERGGKPFGDCDDFSMYLAALLKASGLPAAFRAVGFNGGRLSHVYVVGPYGMKLDPTRDMWNPRLGELLPETSVLEWRI